MAFARFLILITFSLFFQCLGKDKCSELIYLKEYNLILNNKSSKTILRINKPKSIKISNDSTLIVTLKSCQGELLGRIVVNGKVVDSFEYLAADSLDCRALSIVDRLRNNKEICYNLCYYVPLRKQN